MTLLRMWCREKIRFVEILLYKIDYAYDVKSAYSSFTLFPVIPVSFFFQSICFKPNFMAP